MLNINVTCLNSLEMKSSSLYGITEKSTKTGGGIMDIFHSLIKMEHQIIIHYVRNHLHINDVVSGGGCVMRHAFEIGHDCRLFFFLI